MKIYHTETQADYDALMVELEAEGAIWSFGRKLSESNNWYVSEHLTCIRVYDSKVNHASLNYYKEEYPDTPITKYKAKVDEKMKFTKENVERVFDKFMQGGDSLADLKESILNLVDTPEKVAVPKFVADYLEDCKKRNIKLVSALCPFKMGYGKEIELWFDNEDNNRLFALAWINGYEVEKEQLYYIPLPQLETSDGMQQVLSKHKNYARYFSSRPNDKLKQRYTKDELERVPEIYKRYAKLIEEEEE